MISKEGNSTRRDLLDTTNPTKLMKAYGSVRHCCVNIGSNFQPHVSRCFFFLHLYILNPLQTSSSSSSSSSRQLLHFVHYALLICMCVFLEVVVKIAGHELRFSCI
ncbi:unnamed protein product [Musa hybrid cultivar]